MSWIDQHTGIEQALRVECLLGGAQRFGEKRRTLLVIPWTMIAPDRVMMRDRAAVCDHGVERGTLDGKPLRAKLFRIAERMEREVGRGAVRIDVRKTAGDLTLAAGRLEYGRLGRRLDV